MLEQKKSLADLALKLRVLNGPQKNRYLYELDEYTKDYHLNNQNHQCQDPFLPNRITSAIYYSLQGTPYTQPEFVSQITQKDIKAKELFGALFSGIIAYRDASQSERKNFKKSILAPSNPIKKIIHLIKTR